MRGLRGAGRTHQPGSAPGGELGGARSPGAWAARPRPCLGRPFGLGRRGSLPKKTLRYRRPCRPDLSCATPVGRVPTELLRWMCRPSGLEHLRRPLTRQPGCTRATKSSHVTHHISPRLDTPVEPAADRVQRECQGERARRWALAVGTLGGQRCFHLCVTT